MPDRARQQADLIYYLGLLLQPFEDLVEHPERFTASERSRVAARYHAEKPAFTTRIHEFCAGEPGFSYERERYQMDHALAVFDVGVRAHLDSWESLGVELARAREAVLTAALRIPVDHGSVLLEASTPFSTALAIRSRLEAARARVTLVDRYVDGSVYFRLLAATRAETEVVVITWPESRHAPQRWQSLLNASRVFAQERKPRYTLLTSDDIHARWLQVDDRYYILSESFKDAGASAPLTLTLADDATDFRSRIDALSLGAATLFGLGQPSHP